MSDSLPPTIQWRDGVVRMIDQRRLPEELVFLECRTVDELCDAIATLAIRGAPALGVAGAMGVALASVTGEPVEQAAAQIAATRPTAVNLAWGVQQALAAADPVAEALRLAVDDVDRNRRLGAHGARLLPQHPRVLTHCNAGGLACAGYGTAIGVVRAAQEAGLEPSVWVDETRPVLQGARFGTYTLAVLASHHGVPFYVAAPTSTIDRDCPTGAGIPIERRPADEVRELGGTRVAPAAMPVENRAFDVTPAALVTAIITEEGVVRPPYDWTVVAEP